MESVMDPLFQGSNICCFNAIICPLQKSAYKKEKREFLCQLPCLQLLKLLEVQRDTKDINTLIVKK